MALAHQNKFVRYLANVALFTPLLICAFIGFRFYQRLSWPTETNYTRIIQPPPYHAGDIIDVEFRVIRKRTCQLRIDRVFENIDDRREFLATTVTQLVEKDVPLFERKMSYRVAIPTELQPGRYRLFSRFRYYCVAIDNFLPWIRRTNDIELEINQ